MSVPHPSMMAAQYRQQYQGQRGPLPPQSGRRHPGPSHMTPQQHQRQEEEKAKAARKKEEALIRDAEKRRALTPTDKTIPEGIDKLIVGDGVQQYKRLRDVERKLDSIMMRKYLDMKDEAEGWPAFGLRNTRRKKLRIWISNSVENQPWQGGSLEESAFDFNMGVEATYRVKIEGKVIEEKDEEEDADDANDQNGNEDKMDTSENEPANAGGKADEVTSRNGPLSLTQPSQKRTKMSHFFNRITIDFERDKNLQPEGMTQIEWVKPQSNVPLSQPASDFDSLEFERKSDENINITINFFWLETPSRERFLLDKPLSNLLDTDVADRTSIVAGIWEYTKAMGLQHDENRRQINCDERMKAVFNTDVLYFPHVWTAIQTHIFPVPPVSVSYTIRVDPTYHSLPQEKRYTIYDLDIPIHSDPPRIPDTPSLQEIAAHDQNLARLIQAIGKTQRKHSFFSQMARDPVTFTNRWMASQKRDLQIILGEDGKFTDSADLAGEWSRGGKGGVWGGEEVREAVSVMVQKPDKTGRAF